MVNDSVDDGRQCIDECIDVCLLDGIRSQLYINFEEIYNCSGAPFNWIIKFLERRNMFVVIVATRELIMEKMLMTLAQKKGFHWNMFTSTSTMSYNFSDWFGVLSTLPVRPVTWNCFVIN